MEDRKKDHLELALDSQSFLATLNRQFNYEPLLSAHPVNESEPFDCLGRTQRVPLWVSSMTGGTRMAGIINRNLARACGEFGMGMGLGSCRIIMDDETYFEDFNVRELIGDECPFYANLGVAQVEYLLEAGQTGRILGLLDKLKADGLVVHVNPLQEWCQPEGDLFRQSPIDTIKALLEETGISMIVKEVGQGMGPASLRALLALPIEAIEFAAYGGTNFATIELARADEELREHYEPITQVGHDAEEMTRMVNEIIDQGEEVRCKSLIISGGVKDFLHGYYLINKARLPSIYGQASGFLRHARGDYETLQRYVQHQVKGLSLAAAYLRIKED